MAKMIIAITGASGAVYGHRLVSWLLGEGHEVHLVASHAGLLVMRHEMDIQITEPVRDLADLWPGYESQLNVYSNDNIGAVLASGSFKAQAMIIAPCSMASLAAIASGLADNLIHRSADVMIKERRSLILVPRECPLSPIHLENMLKLSRLGVSITAAMPAFYHQPQTIDDMVDFVVAKALDSAGLEHSLIHAYKGNA